MLAARRGHTETVKALVEADADVNLRNRVSPGNLCSTCIAYVYYIVVLVLVHFSWDRQLKCCKVAKAIK